MLTKKPTSNKSLTMPIETWAMAVQISEVRGLPIGQAVALAVTAYWKMHIEEKDSEA